MSSPRLYTYKITFEEVPYYYYGVHKENKYDEYYMGSPITHKWMWDFYTPRKQILEFFSYTDEGWIEANEVEKRIIKPFYQIDQWCLNENCGGIFSLEVLKKNGKIIGNKMYELGIGIHGLSKEERSEIGKKGAKSCKELGIGINAFTSEQLSLHGKKGAEKIKELGLGIHGLTAEERSENGRKSGKKGGRKKQHFVG